MGSGDRPFAPARTWTRQSTEKLQQKMEWRVGCWWSHWLDGVSSASVPSSCISTAGHSTSGLVRCAAVFHSHRLRLSALLCGMSSAAGHVSRIEDKCSCSGDLYIYATACASAKCGAIPCVRYRPSWLRVGKKVERKSACAAGPTVPTK
jgi:hypothetical protein